MPSPEVRAYHLGRVSKADSQPDEDRRNDKEVDNMNAKQNERLRHQIWLRIGLLFLAATTLNGSLWALPFPRSFYDYFPLPGRDWISTLGPYDEHLVRDYGALNLALGILLVATAIFLERRLIRVALVAWLGYAVPHFVYLRQRGATGISGVTGTAANG